MLDCEIINKFISLSGDYLITLDEIYSENV